MCLVEPIAYTLVCHSLESVLMEQIILPKDAIADALVRLLSTEGELSLVRMPLLVL